MDATFQTQFEASTLAALPAVQSSPSTGPVMEGTHPALESHQSNASILGGVRRDGGLAWKQRLLDCVCRDAILFGLGKGFFTAENTEPMKLYCDPARISYSFCARVVKGSPC